MMMDEDENTFQGQKDTPGEIRGATYPNWEHSGAQCNDEETVALSMWERRRQLEVATAPAAMRNTGFASCFDDDAKERKMHWRNAMQSSRDAEISIAKECTTSLISFCLRYLHTHIASVH